MSDNDAPNARPSIGVTKIVKLDGQVLLVSEVLNGNSIEEGEYVINAITLNPGKHQAAPLDNYCVVQFVSR